MIAGKGRSEQGGVRPGVAWYGKARHGSKDTDHEPCPCRIVVQWPRSSQECGLHPSQQRGASASTLDGFSQRTHAGTQVIALVRLGCIQPVRHAIVVNWPSNLRRR
jgi:hypothetical protein